MLTTPHWWWRENLSQIADAFRTIDIVTGMGLKVCLS